MGAEALIVIAVAVVAGVALAVVASGRSPAALSEEAGRGGAADGPPPAGGIRLASGDDVVERPARPDAEAMGVDDEGRPES